MQRILVLLSLLLMSGCATNRALDEHVNIDLSGKSSVYRDQWVHRSPPEVHIRPAGESMGSHTVLFLPFRVTQQMPDPSIAGYTVARVVWQTWLSMQLFPAMEFSSDPTPYRRDVALTLGRQRGADLVVGGFVTYLYAGTPLLQACLILNKRVNGATVTNIAVHSLFLKILFISNCYISYAQLFFLFSPGMHTSFVTVRTQKSARAVKRLGRSHPAYHAP